MNSKVCRHMTLRRRWQFGSVSQLLVHVLGGHNGGKSFNKRVTSIKPDW